MPTPKVENAVVTYYEQYNFYEIRPNEGYLLYEPGRVLEEGESITYHYVYFVPANFDFSTLSTILISDLPEGVQIFGNPMQFN